jgi:hypothetical protein
VSSIDLEHIWDKFISQINSQDFIENAYWAKIAGIPFLYLKLNEPLEQELLEKSLRILSAGAMRGKQLHSQTIFVRKEACFFVYRHRFYVPQQKMFCCGNVCDDCTRLNNDAFW